MIAGSTTRLNPTYEDSVGYQAERGMCRGNRRVVLLLLAMLVAALVFGLLIVRFAMSRDQSSEEELLRSLGREADEDISSKIMDAIDPQNIEDTLR